MRVYVDTGLFIDYLSGRRLTSATLRSEGRRGRPLEQVLDDAERALTRIARHHEGATSALTFYEVEEALYKKLAESATGFAHANAYRVAAARSIVPQAVMAVRFFNIDVLELTHRTVDAQLRNIELQTRGIRAADALHIATASQWNADVIVTTDKAMLEIDTLLRNEVGNPIRCYDSDDALRIL